MVAVFGKAVFGITGASQLKRVDARSGVLSSRHDVDSSTGSIKCTTGTNEHISNLTRAEQQTEEE